MANVYKIGVSIALANGVSPVLGIIAKDLLGVHTGVNKLQGGFSRLKLAIGGAIAIGAGVAILSGAAKVADAGKEIATAQGRMLAAGISNRDVALATATAWKMSADIMGTKVADNLNAVNHLRASFGDLGEARNLAPSYMRNAVALGAITGKDGEDQAYKIAQAIHLSGAAVDPTTKKLSGALFDSQMHMLTSMVSAGGGRISAEDLLSFQKQAGSYGGNLQNGGRLDFIGLIQAMGGQKAGTMIASANRALKDGTMSRPTLSMLEGMGLIDRSKVVTSNGRGSGGASAGGGIQMKAGALINEDMFRHDMPRWVWETLVPKLQAKGLNSTEDQVNWIQHAKLTSNVSRILSELVRNQNPDRNEAKNARTAMGADQYKAVMSKDYEANIKAFHDSLHNLATSLATPLLPGIIKGIQSVTTAVNAVTQWAVANPVAVKAVAVAAIALGAALIGFGVVAIGVAAFAAVAAGGVVGVVIAAIAGIIAAATAFVAFNWDGVVAFFNKAKTVVAGFFNWLIHGDGKDHAGAAGAALNRNVAAAGAAVPAAIGQGPAPIKAPPVALASVTHVHVSLDGKPIAANVAAHIARAGAAGGQNGSSGFDPTISPAPMGMGYFGG